jgi:hypothetical protein
MPGNLKRRATQVGIVVLLVLLALVPVIYPYFSSLLNPWWVEQLAVNSLDFSSMTDIPLSPSRLLAYASAAMQLAKQGNYTGAESTLKLMGHLPKNIEHNLQTFITLVNELVNALDSTGARLDELRQLVDDGAVTLARQKASEVDGLIAACAGRLYLIFSALDRIGTIYRVDVSRQRADLQALSAMLQGYESKLAQLKALLEEVGLQAETKLDISVSSNPVWVEDNFTVTGRLSVNDTGLADRVVDVLFYIKGVGTTVLQAVSDRSGGYTRSYHVSNSSRPASILVFARYAPRGSDLSKLRPARSESINVDVRYYPAHLSLTTSSNRLHVDEGFTVQGRLAGASGEPLASASVELVVDGSTGVSVRTDASGTYSERMSFPSGTAVGTHTLYASFDPTSGVLARTDSPRTVVQLYYLTPTVNLTQTPLILLSGQSFQIQGRLDVDSKPLSEGTLVAVLGDHELSRAVSDARGEFNMTLTAPISATGDNVLQIVYVPQASWFLRSSTTTVLRILNSAVVGLGVGVLVCVGLMISRTSLRTEQKSETVIIPPRRRETEEAPEQQKIAAEISVPRVAALRLSDLRSIEDARVRVRESYWAVRRIFAKVLGEPGRLSETHREFERRTSPRLSGAAAQPFSGLTRLFEMAEYSQHAPTDQDANAAVNFAILVSEALNVRIIS